MSEWKEYRFSDFVLMNPTVKLPANEQVSFVEMKDLENGKRYCYPSSTRLNSSGAKFENRDTLFARITPCLENGKICQVKGLKNGVGLGSTEFLVFRGKPNVSDTDFVFYLSRWDEVRSHAEINLDGTSGRQRVPKECFNELILNLPKSLTEQKSIASILSSLDDKIDLLHRQNATLEKMAETLFRQWFVEEAKADWEIKPLGSLVTVKRGGSPRPIQDYLSDTGLRWLKISDATKENSPYIFEIKEHIKIEGLNKTTHLKAGTLVLSNSATPGIAKILQVDTCIHDGWLHFPKSHFSNEFLYLLFKKIRPELLQQGNGSIFTNLKTDILKEYPIPIPDNESLLFFDNQVKPIFNKILKNQIQIRTLTALRDTLLPKLMSGELIIDN
ncbi:MAG: Type I restriction modification DNA specificity domain protein [Bacteroidetes bacterium ADurb.Bin234]|nr:MAG: Type I restriction modification DNA specificity domain protein [Bacteroidetes bacterium ADurb.Bin234]